MCLSSVPAFSPHSVSLCPLPSSILSPLSLLATLSCANLFPELTSHSVSDVAHSLFLPHNLISEFKSTKSQKICTTCRQKSPAFYKIGFNEPCCPSSPFSLLSHLDQICCCQTFTYISIFIYIYTYSHIYMCIYMYMFTCTCIHLYVLYT